MLDSIAQRRYARRKIADPSLPVVVCPPCLASCAKLVEPQPVFVDAPHENVRRIAVVGHVVLLVGHNEIGGALGDGVVWVRERNLERSNGWMPFGCCPNTARKVALPLAM